MLICKKDCSSWKKKLDNSGVANDNDKMLLTGFIIYLFRRWRIIHKIKNHRLIEILKIYLEISG